MKKKKRIIPYDDYNGKVPPPEKRDYVGTLTPQFGNTALRNGWKIIEVYEEEGLCNGQTGNDSER